jgi:myo-inositol 2-dehydrogenase/D-chiro-inositol 1-dehydrogenase
VLSQCLSGFEHHTLLEIAGDAGAARTWWSGAMDRTLHPDFALAVRSGAGEPRTISIPVSGEIFELEENLRLALQGFDEGESVLSPKEARHSVEICLAAEESLRTGQPVRLAGD